MAKGMLKLALVLQLLVVQQGVQAVLKCQIDGSSLETSTVFGSVDFEFWYAVGLTGSSMLDDLRIFELEQLMYSSINEEVLWCKRSVEQDDPTGQEAVMSNENESVEDSTEGTQSGEGRLRKRALQNPIEETVLGPVLFTPGRKDEVTECKSELDSNEAVPNVLFVQSSVPKDCEIKPINAS